MQNLNISYRSADARKPNPRNARTHSKKQIRQIAESIKELIEFAQARLALKQSGSGRAAGLQAGRGPFGPTGG